MKATPEREEAPTAALRQALKAAQEHISLWNTGLLESSRRRLAAREVLRAIDAALSLPDVQPAQEPVIREILPEHTRRWNVEPQDDGSMLVCKGLHDKFDACEFERFVPVQPALAEQRGEALRLAREYVEEASTRGYDGTGGFHIRAEAKRRLALIDAALAAWGEPTAKPIETAPMLGKPLLLYWKHAGWVRGRFVDDEQGRAGWMGDGDQIMPRNQADCTHWMPLPEKP